MTRRELKKNAYRMIVKENKSHQDTFDELRRDQVNGPEELAEDISKIPSQEKQKQNQTLVYIYVGMLALVILLRIVGITLTFGIMNIEANMLLVLIALGVILPAAGIFGALTRRQDSYRTIGILLIVSIARALTRGEVAADPLALIWLTPTAVAIALAFYIPTRLKTNFTKKLIQAEVDGKIKKTLEITFQAPDKIFAPDVLDANL